MARTRLFSQLQRLYRDFAAADRTGLTVGEVRTARSRSTPTRREFLAASAASAAVALSRRPLKAADLRPSGVAIIGGGIAGLTAALTLADAGLSSVIYEASGRVGGRMHSDTTDWANGQYSEHCGELIDSDHTTIMSLAQRFGIPLVDVLGAQPPGSTETYYFAGQYYPRAQADVDFQPVYQHLQTDLQEAGFPTVYYHYTQVGWALDHMSVYNWIETRVPGGHGSMMGQLLDVAYDIEYGAKTTEQSSLNLIYLLAYQTNPSDFDIFGSSDEHYKMQGGNERLPAAIAAKLPPGSIQLNTPLRSIALQPNGKYVLGFPNGTVTAAKVILTVPFSILRTLDYSGAGFNPLKVTAIQQLGYGSNVKLQLQFQSRLWNQPGPWGVSTGSSYADTGYQNTWEVTRGQSGATGILVDYLGSAGAQVTGDPNNPQVVHAYATAFLTQLEPVFPGITNLWNGRATLDTPLYNPYLLGSYSNWKVGQYTQFAGAERQRSNNCFFAGEHCSINFQGFMEGGAETGIQAARQVLLTR
jgi:monoamine oxidase